MVIKSFLLISILFTTAQVFATKKPPLGKEAKSSRERREDKARGHLLTEPLFTTGKNKNETSGIGVNTYLWKASLEALSFLPKDSVDPFGGTIITEWYSPPETPQERLKMEIIITSRSLQSDGIRITIFKERKNSSGKWIDTPIDPDTLLKVEETILTRARELKVAEEISKE